MRFVGDEEEPDSMNKDGSLKESSGNRADASHDKGALPNDASRDNAVLPNDASRDNAMLPNDASRDNAMLPNDASRDNAVLPNDASRDNAMLPNDASHDTRSATGVTDVDDGGLAGEDTEIDAAKSQTCSNGYESTDDGECRDIDECERDNGGCGELSCTNNEGSWTCGPCPLYYREDGETGCIRLWTKQFGASDNDQGFGVATDSSGNVYVTGYTQSALDGNTSEVREDIFIIKVTREGVTEWTRQLGTPNNCNVGEDIATDSSGYVYVTGHTNGDLDGNTSAGGEDAFLIKFNGEGIEQWTQQLGSSDSDFGEAVATDSSGNVYVTGYAEGDLDGNTNAGKGDIVLIKFSGEGVKQWTKQLGTSGDDQGRGVATDGSGNVYITGGTEGGLDGNTNAGQLDMFLIKFTEEGVKQWTRQLGTADSDVGFGVATDSSGNVYVTGGMHADLSGNTTTLNSDIFIAKYTGEGVEQWTRQLGTTNSDVGYDIATDSSGNLYVTGMTLGDLDGNTNMGFSDIFITKYDSAGNQL